MSENNAMTYIVATPLFFLAFILQTTVLWRMSIEGYTPNLMLVMIVVFAFLYDEHYALTLGLFFGALLDIASSLYFGMQTLSFVLIYIIVRLARNFFNHESLLGDMLMCLVSTPINLTLVWALYLLLGVRESFMYVLVSMPYVAGMNLAWTLILHLIFVRGVMRWRGDRKFKGGI